MNKNYTPAYIIHGAKRPKQKDIQAVIDKAAENVKLTE